MNELVYACHTYNEITEFNCSYSGMNDIDYVYQYVGFDLFDNYG